MESCEKWFSTIGYDEFKSNKNTPFAICSYNEPFEYRCNRELCEPIFEDSSLVFFIGHTNFKSCY